MLGLAQVCAEYDLRSAIAVSDAADAADATEGDEATRSAPGLSPIWVAAQLVPSPEVVTGEGVTRFGMRWQVTPVLYSFGVHRSVSPWRSFIAEPLVRHGGSLELFVGPEYIFHGRTFMDGLLWRVGGRAYFPLLEYGDDLSMSVGTSYFAFAGRSGVAYEAGLYSLFGLVGAQFTWSPSGGPAAAIATLRLRYF